MQEAAAGEAAAEAETAEPAWLRDVDEQQKHEMLKLVSQGAQHYSSVDSPSLRDDLQIKFGISPSQAEEVINWITATNEVNLSVPDCD